MKEKILRGLSWFMTIALAFNLSMVPVMAAGGGSGGSSSGGSGGIQPIIVASISNAKVISVCPCNPTANNTMSFSYDYSNLSSSSALITLKIYHMLGNIKSIVKTWTPSSLTGPSNGGSGTWTRSWDGVGDSSVPNSTAYYFEVSGTSGNTTLNTITAGPFTIDNTLVVNGNNPPVVNPTPSLNSVTVVSAQPYAPNGGSSLQFNYSYDGLSGAVTVNFKIKRFISQFQIYSTVKTENLDGILNGIIGTGSKDYFWDGNDPTDGNKDAIDGSYQLEISGTNTDNNQTTTLGPITVDFTVQNTQIVVNPPANLAGSLSNAKLVGNDSFYNFTSAPMQFSVDYANFINGSLDARLYYKVGMNETDVATWGGIQLPLNGSGTKMYSWDGLGVNNHATVDGNYYFEVSGSSNGNAVTKTTSPVFTVKNPTITNVTFSTTDYNPNQGSLTIGFDLNDLQNGQQADVVFYISTVSQNPQVVYIKSLGMLGNGHHTITWNGTGSNLGVYGAVFSATAMNGVSFVKGSIANNSFNVVGNGPAPVDPNATTVTGLSVTPNPYDPSKGPAVLSYTVNNWTNSTMVDATIYDLNNNVISQWTGAHPVSGANTITWTAPTSLVDGLYLFEVKGVGIAVAKAVFTVNNTASDLPPGTILCSIFPDNPKVAQDSDDCKAIKYFKEKGVFTGTAQGNLDPYGLLQRDQVTKVLLTAFSKYDAAVNYCTGTTMLKDIGQGAWYDNYVCRGTNLTVGGKAMITGYASGADKGYFRPDWKVNRAEFAALVFRLFGNAGSSLQADVKSTDWYADYAKSVKFYNLWSGNFDAQKTLSRLEVIQALYKLHLADGSKI